MSSSDTISPQLMDRKGRLWQERTVIVKQEENGFGFTLTQEMPVFVDKVFNGSSAQKAGIHPKDRIIKVNGVSVVGHKHQDVVDMIKDSSHVSLTVISKLAGTNGSHHRGSISLDSSHQIHQPSHQSNIEISAPRQLQELTLQSLKTMLHKQKRNYECLSVDYCKQRTERLEKELRDCESIIRILEMEIASKSPSIEAHIKTTSASVQALTPGKILRPSQEERALIRHFGAEGEGTTVNQKTSSPDRLLRIGSVDLSSGPLRSQTFSSNGNMSPIKILKYPFNKKSDLSDDGSDDDLSDEVDGASEAGPFSSLQELKGNPAHMSVFLHYLFMSKDPKYLLFYLVVTSYQTYCKSVQMLKQRGMDIYWTFFLDQSPLDLNVDDYMKLKILNNLETEENESRLKSVFVEARESLSEIIITDLGHYRHKRVLGLAGMFGDQLLTHKMPLPKQLEVMTTLLTSDLKICLDEKGASCLQECIKNQSIAACIATFLMDVLTQGNKTNIKLPAILEKIQSFTRSDILMKKGKPKKKFPTLTRTGHSFQLTSLKTPTDCDLCGRPLWGVVYHGYQCCFCDINIHRFCCINEVADCAGQKIKPRITLRKLSTQRKIASNVIPVPDESEYGGGGKDSKADTAAEEEEDRVSPPIEVTLPQAPPEDDDLGDMSTQTFVRKTLRNRSITDPKQNLAPPTIISSRPPGEKNEQSENPRPKVDLSRAQSERLQAKPDTLLKQRSIEANTLSWGGGELSSADEAQLGNVKTGTDTIAEGKQQLEDEDIQELRDDIIEEEPIPWALVARREVVQSMKRYEVARQENIRELVYTERTHLHKLKIMKYMYKIPLQKQNILSGYQVEQLFPSLEELILFHSGLCADLRERIGSSNQDTLVVKNIADVLLQRFEGAAGERLCHACSIFASNQAKAEKLCKEWKRKNDRFRIFLKSTESHSLSQRLTLTELMPIAWTRLTRYKLLIENILHSYKKYSDDLDEVDKAEAAQVETAIGCVKRILKYVNKQVKKASNKQKLADYQSKMDMSAMEKAQHPIAQLFKNLDLTADNRMLIHEGPLTWRLQHRKVVELHALLLTDVLVLLEKHEDKDKYYLRTHTVETIAGTKEELSTVVRLKDCLLRTAAADRGGRTFLLVNNSNLLKLAQMYEFIAENPQEKKKWEDSIQHAMMGTQAMLSPELPSSPIGDEYAERLPLGLSTLTSHFNTREQLDKIDDDMKRLMNDKIDILRSIQVGIGHRSSESTPQHLTSDSPREVIKAVIEQTGEITSTVSHIMVPNPTKSIVAETQLRLADIIHELQRNLSRLMLIMKDEEYSGTVGRYPLLDFAEDASSESIPPVSDKSGLQLGNDNIREIGGGDGSLGELDITGGGGGGGGGLHHDSTEVALNKQDWSSYNEKLFAIGERKEEEEEEGDVKNVSNKTHSLTLVSRSDSGEGSGGTEEFDIIVAPPDIFSGGDHCTTPTPEDFMSHTGTGMDSGASTPRSIDSPSSLDSLTGKVSPLTTFLKAEKSSDDVAKEKSKVQSPNISHSLHESHSVEPCVGSSVSEESMDYTSLSIAPRDSPMATATSKVVSILSKSNLKPPGKDLSSESDNPDFILVSLPGDESDAQDDGTTI